MSAIAAGRRLFSPDSRRRPPRHPQIAASAFRPPAGGARQPPDPRSAMPSDPHPTETCLEELARNERARQGRLRSLWQMTPAELVAAMRRGGLTYEQLAAWSARHPEKVPLADGEFEWLAVQTPEACE